MIICKPDWITHADRSDRGDGLKGAPPSIYSVHVHPDGKRLATGSLDSKVKIWNTLPIFSEEAEHDTDCHKLLCTMERHSGAVLCVRWSSNGRYLASASDSDNITIIWELDSNRGTNAVFGSTNVNYESWVPKKFLHGHDSDVQDLAWTKDSRYLASGSVDGTVIVWDGSTFEQVARLDQEAGFVKGICWDPAGKYLAAQTEEKTMKIWRTVDWGVEKEIKAPFINAPSTTFFRRLSWSPNGAHICAANAVNGAHCIAAIIDRNNWTTEVSLVGHQMPITATCFSPKLFYYSTSQNTSATEDNTMEVDSSSGPELVEVCAIGGQEQSISIWLTKQSKPLCVMSDIFENEVLDLAWSPDGLSLYACSQDGTVACIRFDTDLGTSASDAEMERQLSAYGTHDTLVPESVTQLNLEEQSTLVKTSPAPNRIADLMGTTPSDAKASANDTTNITPTPVTPERNLPGSSTVNGDAALPAVTNNIQAKTTDRPHDAGFTSSSSDNKNTALLQKVTIGKDGKRRIQPMMVQSPRASTPQLNPTQSAPSTATSMSPASTTVNHPSTGTTMVAPTAVTESTRQHVFYDDPSLPARLTGNKREATTDEITPSSRKRPVWLDSAMLPPSASTSPIKLGVPKIMPVLERKMTIRDQVSMMECQNPEGEGASCSRITMTSEGRVIWTDYLTSPILIMTGGSSFSAVACEDGSIHVYSETGRRLLPPIVLESTAVILTASADWLLCLTSVGLLYTWDIPKQTSCLSQVSVGPVLRIASVSEAEEETPAIKGVRIQRNGLPLLMTNYQEAYTYHTGMKVWLRITDSWYIISQFWAAAGSGHGQTPDTNPLGWLASALSSSEWVDPTSDTLMKQASAHEDISNTITTRHIEIQLAVAALLDSPEEYQDMIIHYAKRLALEGAVLKTQELCRWLLGPPFGSMEEGWGPTILGTLKKHELLKTILPILSCNAQLRRHVEQYTDYISEQDGVSF